MWLLWFGAVEALAVPAVREVHVQLERRRRRAARHVARGDRRRWGRRCARLAHVRPVERGLDHAAVPVGHLQALRPPGARVAPDHAQSGRERPDRARREAAVVDRRSERLHRLVVQEERRRPVGGGVGLRPAGRPVCPERRERRERVRRDVADERVVVRQPGLPGEDDRVVPRAVAEAADADEIRRCSAPGRAGATSGLDGPGCDRRRECERKESNTAPRRAHAADWCKIATQRLVQSTALRETGRLREGDEIDLGQNDSTAVDAAAAAAPAPDRDGSTALLLALDETAPQLAPVRAELHPASVALGLPLHLTLLYPFVPRAACDRRSSNGSGGSAPGTQPCPSR